MARESARLLARGLKKAGVLKIFGVPGGGPNLDMIGAAQDLGLDFVLSHTETAACIMAGSYGRLTGTAGVAIVTRGPGLTSAGNGLAQATLDRFPLVLISDSVPSTSAPRVAHQRLDLVAAAAPLTKWSGILGGTDPEAGAEAAARLAMAQPAGAVHVSFDPTTPGDAVPLSGTAPVAAPAVDRQILDLLGGAHRPIVILGLDAGKYAQEMRSALSGLDCPILVTYQAKGTIPESWPSYAGLFTGAAVERPLLEQADLVLCIGLDVVEPLPGPWSYFAPVIMLHSHPTESAYFGEPLVSVGRYSDTLPIVLKALQSDWPSGLGAKTRGRDLHRLETPTGNRLTPHQVVHEVGRAVGDVPITVDAGAHMLVVMPIWETNVAESVLISNGLATMGFALPAAIGAAIAHPDKQVVCFTGDGGLGMALAELETLSRCNLNVTVVVFNDARLSLIALKQGVGQGGPSAVCYDSVDFGRIASACGVAGHTVQSADELRRALAGGGCGPKLIDAKIDPAGYQDVIKATRG